MKPFLFILTLGAASLNASPVLAETAGETAKPSMAVQSERQARVREYLLGQRYRDHEQDISSQRQAASDIGQAGGNQGGARGHHQAQQQGGVQVGSLVKEAAAPGTNAGGFAWQYGSQSNTLTVGGDNNAPISLSNINANGGNVHIGDVNKGNLYNSQIGNNQSGVQGGDTRNHQQNGQQQAAASGVASQDHTENGGP